MSDLESIDAPAAARLAEEGALLVDIREDNEFARLSIPGSVQVALSRLEAGPLPAGQRQKVVFLCASGGRTRMAASRLAALAGDRAAYVLEGGLFAWQRAGLPVQTAAPAERGGAAVGFLARLFAR